MGRKLLFIMPMLLFTNVIFGQAGNWVWGRQATGSGAQEGWSTTTDVYGNEYATGIYHSTITFGSITLTNEGDADIFIVKYSLAGAVLWAKRAGSINYEATNSIATDSLGNIFITGYFAGPTIVFDTDTLTNSIQGSTNMFPGNMFIVKYSPTGMVLWAKSAGGNNLSNSIATDASGNVFVTGFFEGSTIVFDTIALPISGSGIDNMFIVKYSSAGTVLWAKRPIGYSFGNSIATDASGNIYATGFFKHTIQCDTFIIPNTTVNDWDILIVKYSTSGTVLWAKSAGGIHNDIGMSIATDATSNVYVTGYFNSPSVVFGTDTLTNANNSGNINDMFIVKYNSSGTMLLAKSAGGFNDDVGYSVASVFSSNASKPDIYVTGSFISPSIVFDSDTLFRPTGATDPMFIVKYDNDLNVICASALPSGGDDNNSVATDNFGNAYIVGDFYGTNPFIIGADTLAVSGTENFFIAKYNCNAMPDLINVIAEQFYISIYPNPTENIFTVCYNGTCSDICINIKNILGQTIISKKYSSQKELKESFDLSKEGKGVYSIELVAGEVRKVKKVVIE